MSKNRVKLNICGISCSLITEDSEEYMESLAGEVEATMKAFMKATGLMKPELAAVTTALSFCDELKKERAAKPDNAAEKELKRQDGELRLAKERIRELEGQLERAQAEWTGDGPKPEVKKQLKNPLRLGDEFEQQGFVSFFEKEL